MTDGKQTRNRLARVVRLTAICVSLLSAHVVWSADSPDPSAEPQFLEAFDEVVSLTDRLDWGAETSHISRALNRIWYRNGWTNEADRFALNLTREISAIPPRNPLKRMELLNKRIAERYGLSDGEAMRFQGAMMQEAVALVTRGGGSMLQPLCELMEARASSRPLTSEQVAAWAEAGGPLLAEFSQTAGRLAKQLEPMVKPEKREVFQRDLRAFEKRGHVVEELNARWAKGRWKPKDWGIEDDPIQTGKALELARKLEKRQDTKLADRERATLAKIPKPVAYDPTTWFAYALEFQERFALDAGQMSTAESILTELLNRAEAYTEQHADALKAVPAGERNSHEMYSPICALYAEFQARLDSILTSTQRDRGED